MNKLIVNVWGDILIELQIILYTTVYITYTGVRDVTHTTCIMCQVNMCLFLILDIHLFMYGYQ